MRQEYTSRYFKDNINTCRSLRTEQGRCGHSRIDSYYIREIISNVSETSGTGRERYFVSSIVLVMYTYFQNIQQNFSPYQFDLNSSISGFYIGNIFYFTPTISFLLNYYKTEFQLIKIIFYIIFIHHNQFFNPTCNSMNVTE